MSAHAANRREFSRDLRGIVILRVHFKAFAFGSPDGWEGSDHIGRLLLQPFA